MRYYAKHSNGKLVCIGIGSGGEEITEEQYYALRTEVHEKLRYTDLACKGEIELEDIPEKWRSEIENLVAEYNESEVAAEEALAELLEVLAAE